MLVDESISPSFTPSAVGSTLLGALQFSGGTKSTWALFTASMQISWEDTSCLSGSESGLCIPVTWSPVLTVLTVLDSGTCGTALLCAILHGALKCGTASFKFGGGESGRIASSNSSG